MGIDMGICMGGGMGIDILIMTTEIKKSHLIHSLFQWFYS